MCCRVRLRLLYSSNASGWVWQHPRRNCTLALPGRCWQASSGPRCCCPLRARPVCFHPAALWAARCIRQTREMACDAEAAQSMGSPADYAWALLQVAERTNTQGNHATAAGFFSNGLFGAGLQLFTNRGAMEERMGMLMNENESEVRGRAVRVAAGVSVAAVAVVAATMLQVQPTLAAERSSRLLQRRLRQGPLSRGASPRSSVVSTHANSCAERIVS